MVLIGRVESLVESLVDHDVADALMVMLTTDEEVFRYGAWLTELEVG